MKKYRKITMSLAEYLRRHQTGEYRHHPVGTSKLDEADLADLRQLAEDLKEVQPQPFERWEANFSCDRHPKREIALWKAMASLYKDLITGETLTIEQKGFIFMEIIAASYQTHPPVFE